MPLFETAPMTERKDDRLWGGRFEREPNAHFDAFQRSFAFDRRLLPYEIAVDRAWAKALEPIGIFSADEVRQTLAALDKISDRAKTDPGWVDSFGANAEDVHHFVEKALVEELGPLGWKLHTGRSRNELVATDFRLFVIDAAAEIQRGLSDLLNSFLAKAKSKARRPHGRHDAHAARSADSAFTLSPRARGGLPAAMSPGCNTAACQRGRLPNGLWRARWKFLRHRSQRHRARPRLFHG